MRQTKQGDGFSNLFRKSASRQSNGRKARNQLKIFIVLIEIRTGGQLTEFHLTESVDRKFLII